MNDPIKKPNALLLADELKKLIDLHPIAVSAVSDAADELCRQHYLIVSIEAAIGEVNPKRTLVQNIDSIVRTRIEFADYMSQNIIAMQAACIEFELAETPDECPEWMSWIYNTLSGPGFIVDEEDYKELGSAQAWFNKAVADLKAHREKYPMPVDPEISELRGRVAELEKEVTRMRDFADAALKDALEPSKPETRPVDGASKSENEDAQ